MMIMIINIDVLDHDHHDPVRQSVGRIPPSAEVAGNGRIVYATNRTAFRVDLIEPIALVLGTFRSQ
jgi:hypothetical protein